MTLNKQRFRELVQDVNKEVECKDREGMKGHYIVMDNVKIHGNKRVAAYITKKRKETLNKQNTISKFLLSQVYKRLLIF